MQYRSYAVISNRRVADQEEEAIVELNKKVVVSLLDAAMYLARQGLALRREPENESQHHSET